MTKFFVFDTNCLVSASILPDSTVRHAFDKAVMLGAIASSQEVFDEYTEVLFEKNSINILFQLMRDYLSLI